METKYGKISDITVEVGLEGYIDKIFKILPMKEEKCSPGKETHTHMYT